jgi:transposase
MTLKTILSSAKSFFIGFTKTGLIEIILQLQKDFKALEKENIQLKEKLQKNKIDEVSKQTNKPSSKKADWEKDIKNKPSQQKKRKRKRFARKGSGNQAKTRKANKFEYSTVDICGNCGKNLQNKKALLSINEHIVEDIPNPIEQTDIIKIIKEKKYCTCQHVTTAKSVSVLPQSDIGINITILICYLWIALCLPFTKIKDYLSSFYHFKISTSGLSKHIMIITEAMKPVYEEIHDNIKNDPVLFADETGWRVKGKNWWLWVFGTTKSAYFVVDQSRGSDVVRRVLGEIFLGVLVVDGWSAYLSLTCEKQTCMAHIFRKIRKLRDAFPELSSVHKFYIKLRRIIRDGEKLQQQRDEINDIVFQRRLLKLHNRLENLVQWKNPNTILLDIIQKVKRQQPRILTFIEHPNVPSDNNYAERLIRIGVLKRKISGGSMSAKGANSYAILLSIYTTCRLRKISFRKYMKQSLTCFIKTGQPMLLKEYETLMRSRCNLEVAA